VERLTDIFDDNYHVDILDPNTREVFGNEEKFQTLEEVLGFLHKFEESEKIRERMFACLTGLRDGVSEVTIHREEFHAGNQVLRIRPAKQFQKLFWKGFE
jgi:hypothetical protein